MHIIMQHKRKCMKDTKRRYLLPQPDNIDERATIKPLTVSSFQDSNSTKIHKHKTNRPIKLSFSEHPKMPQQFRKMK